jgi:hypothetical protein
LTKYSFFVIIVAYKAKRTPMNHAQEYQRRVEELEDQDMTTSDAQAVADAEFMQKYGLGWEFSV